MLDVVVASFFDAADVSWRSLLRWMLVNTAVVVLTPLVFINSHRCRGFAIFAYLSHCVMLIAGVVQLRWEIGVARVVISQVDSLPVTASLTTLLEEHPELTLPLVQQVVAKLDLYTDVVFLLVAFDCGSSVWWAAGASLACWLVLSCLFNVWLSATDCAGELSKGFGFLLLDFKIVNGAILTSLPDLDQAASDPQQAFARESLTPGSVATLVAMERSLALAIPQVAVQCYFLSEWGDGSRGVVGFVVFSILVSLLYLCCEALPMCWASIRRVAQGQQEYSALQVELSKRATTRIP